MSRGVRMFVGVCLAIASCRGDDDVDRRIPLTLTTSESADAVVEPVRVARAEPSPPVPPISVARVKPVVPRRAPARTSGSNEVLASAQLAPGLSPIVRASDDLDRGIDMLRLDRENDAQPLELSTTAPTTRKKLRKYGMMLDVGVPDGATAALVYRPLPALQFAAGLSYNGFGAGVRGGATWVPLRGWFSPTLSLDYGHYNDGDANPLVRWVTGNPMFSSPLLDRVGYDYADAHVGVEFGRRTFAFYIRAGVSRVTGSVHDIGALSSGKMPAPLSGTDPSVTLTTISGRLGCIYYFQN